MHPSLPIRSNLVKTGTYMQTERKRKYRRTKNDQLKRLDNNEA